MSRVWINRLVIMLFTGMQYRECNMRINSLLSDFHLDRFCTWHKMADNQLPVW